MQIEYFMHLSTDRKVYEEQKVVVETVKLGRIDPSVFAIPKGYRDIGK